MSARRLFLAGALLGLPALLSAQGRRQSGGGGVGSKTGVGADITSDPVRPTRKDPFSTKELQKENMVAFLLDKKKDLKLSDDEVKMLKQINDHLKDTVSVPMHSLDSLSSEMKRGGPDQDDRVAARVFGPQYLAEVRAQYDSALKDALSKLTDEQQKAANEKIDQRRKELAPQDKPER